MRVLAVAAGLTALASVGLAELAAQRATDTTAEAVVLELQIGRLASRTVPAYRVRSEALVPLTHFLQLAEIRFRMAPEGRLEATLDPGRVRLIVDATGDSMSFGDHRVRLERDFRRFEDGELYVGAERLGDLLGLQVQVVWSELTVTVMDPGILPIARRIYRESARSAFLRRADGGRPDLALPLERPRWDGLVFDYSVLAPSHDVLAGGAYTAALGADALGGSLQMGVRSVGPVDDAHARLEGSWTVVWRESWLAQLRLGTGSTSGPHPRPQHGFFLTNAPFVRPSLVGVMPFIGRLEPGWSVEAYRGGELVAYDSADPGGRFAVDLPVRYGENPVDFVAYGPFGEIREYNRTYHVFEDLLPARRFEYGLSAGACADPLCSAAGNVDLRYGISRRWTVSAGADQFWRDSLPTLSHPYVTLTGAPTTDWGVALEGVAEAFGRAALRFEPSLRLRVGGSYATFARGVLAPVLTDSLRRSQWTLTALLRPAPQRGYAYFEATIDGDRTDSGTTQRARIGASALTRVGRWLPYARIERDDPAHRSAILRSYVGLTAFMLPRPELGTVFGRVWLRGSAELERVAGVTTASLFAGRDLGPGIRLEAGAHWSRGAGTALALTLASYLPGVRTLTSVNAQAGTRTAASQLVQGSVIWDRAGGRLVTAPGPSLERSGLTGRVFLDEDANGRWSPGEPPLPGVRILVGTLTATSDAEGTYRVWDLIPFEPVTVRVDSLSLDSPLLVPEPGTVSVVPGPNRFRALDVPIATAGVLEGRVVRSGTPDARGVPGVTLILTNRRTGLERRFATFTDGGFYLLGVTAGDYDLRVDPRQLEAMGATADAVPLTLAPTAEGVGRSGLVLVVRPRT